MPHWHDLDFFSGISKLLTMVRWVRGSGDRWQKGRREGGSLETPNITYTLYTTPFENLDKWKFFLSGTFTCLHISSSSVVNTTCKDVRFWVRTHTYKPAELVSHDLWQKPHPCAFKILSFDKMTSNTSVAFGQATSSGFLGSIALSCGQKPLSPFLAPLWPDSNLKTLERFLTLQVAHHPNGPFWVEKQ